MMTCFFFQKRFYINSLYESNEIYPIPITYATEQTPDFYTMKPVFIMNERSHLFNLTGLRAAPWVIFNIQETGKIEKHVNCVEAKENVSYFRRGCKKYDTKRVRLKQKMIEASFLNRD